VWVCEHGLVDDSGHTKQIVTLARSISPSRFADRAAQLGAQSPA
jgi:hypothetical protein